MTNIADNVDNSKAEAERGRDRLASCDDDDGCHQLIGQLDRFCLFLLLVYRAKYRR